MLSSIHISDYFLSTEESRYFIASTLETSLKQTTWHGKIIGKKMQLGVR